nr:MaoC/PaaZ C-terminal domain-containing protein [Rhodococcus sp. (in: high G+C Gram-positive bacteria)]
MSENTQLPDLQHPPITRLDLIKYAGASGDFNPIHLDEDTARKMGLDGIIAHGMLSMGLLGQYAGSVEGAAFVRRLSVRFRAMVRVGDVLTCRARVLSETEDGQRLEIWAETQRGDVVVTGEAEIIRDHAAQIS